MFKNYFKIALRSLWRNKGLSFINIFGLATGMACSLVIFLYVRDEWSYDRFHAGADHIYRVVKDFVNDDGSRLPDATTPPALGPAIEREIPEVQAVTRIYPGWGSKYLLTYGDKKFVEDRLYRVDSNFFDVFSFPFVKGNAGSAFKDVNAILLTRSAAKKYFGSEEPVGKVLHVGELGDMMVSGVLEDVPENAHFHFDFLVSIRKFSGDIDAQWFWYNFYTYLKLKPNTQIASIEPKIKALYHNHVSGGKDIIYTQPLTGIHLGSDLKWELEPNGNKLYVYAFSLIAIFVIVIACINYVNLATARSAMRAKEIGVRKVSGAFKTTLIKQFLSESILTALIAFLAALLLTQFLLPLVDQMTGKHLSMSFMTSPSLLLQWLLIAVVIGVAAGAYPALHLSAFRPVQVLKGTFVPEKGAFNLRKALVVLQFTISVGLITGTLVVKQQIEYMQHVQLGLNKDQVMIINDAGSLSKTDRKALLYELSKINGVIDAATANGVIGGLNWTNKTRYKGSQSSQLINFLGISYDYLDVLGIRIKEGRNFSPEFPADTFSSRSSGSTERILGSVILNEKAVSDLGIPGPAVGSLISWGQDHDTVLYLKVVGIASDFHFASFKNEIKPFGFVLNNVWQTNFTIKVSPSNLTGTITAIEKKWKAYSQDRPFQYSFLDETFAALYKSEQRLDQVFLYITSLAIIIACMGLFGLTAFLVEKRTKEIGIRKVVGASVPGIVLLLSKDFIRLTLLSFALASPLAWYCMYKWLQDFAYRTSISWWILVLSGGISLVITLMTVSLLTVKAALENPVRSLRTE